MTWRERIEAARVRGSFTEQDHSDVCDGETCFVGEVALRYGVDYMGLRSIARAPFSTHVPTDLTDSTHLELGSQPIFIVFDNDFDAADRILDEIEREARRMVDDTPDEGGEA